MDRIVAILKDFTDRELAFFYKYRLQQYASETQEEIRNFIFEKRLISLDKMEALRKTANRKNGFCQRCGSDKIFNYDVDYELPVFRKISYDEYLDLYNSSFKKIQIECFVCGNIIENPNETYIDKILKSLKGN